MGELTEHIKEYTGWRVPESLRNLVVALLYRLGLMVGDAITESSGHDRVQ